MTNAYPRSAFAAIAFAAATALGAALAAAPASVAGGPAGSAEADEERRRLAEEIREELIEEIHGNSGGEQSPDGRHRVRNVRVIRADGPWIGISLEGVEWRDDESAGGGIRVTRVHEDSPAEQAGLAEGDLIVALDGREDVDVAWFLDSVRSREPGETVSIGIRRDGVDRTFDIELGSWPESFTFDLDDDRFNRMMPRFEALRELGPDVFSLHFGPDVWLGVGTQSLTPELRSHFGAPRDRGVLVSRVEEGAPAEKAGVLVGDVILQVDGTPVESTSDILTALREREEGDLADLRVLRGRSELALSVALAKRPGYSGGNRWQPRAFAVGPGTEELDLARRFAEAARGEEEHMRDRVRELELEIERLTKRLAELTERLEREAAGR